MVTLRSLLLAVLATLSAMSSSLAEESVDPADARLEVVIQAHSETPYVGEMILVTLRGIYDLTISLEKFDGIELRNFSWVQLGRDQWTRERVDGREVTVVERKIAAYPQKAGTLQIGPFRHHLTLSTLTGRRYVHDVISDAVDVTVQPKPKTNGNWWLPATDVVLTDEWDMDPGNLANGATATRTITITAVGQTADHLPPPPKMMAPWLITFLAPEERWTDITRDGPTGTVRWVWRMRPARSEPGDLKAFNIPWFDIDAREMREVVMGSRRVAFAAINEPDRSEERSRAGLLAGLVVAFGIGLPVALSLPGRRFLSMRELKGRFRRYLPNRADLALRRAVRRNDPAAFRAAATRAYHDEAANADIRGALDPVDRYLYAPGSNVRPDLRATLGLLRKAARAGRQL